jgi:uncharacterized membrane protein
MIPLALLVALFAVIHLIPSIPAVKRPLAAQFGRAWGPVYGVVSLTALVLVVLAWRAAPVDPIYDPPLWGFYATFALVLAGFVCLGIFLCRGTWRQRLAMPLSFGVILWGVGHLFSNGDLASIILFTGFALYGAAHLGIGLATGYRPSPEVRKGHDGLSLLVGVALFGLMTQLHGVLVGVPILTLTR